MLPRCILLLFACLLLKKEINPFFTSFPPGLGIVAVMKSNFQGHAWECSDKWGYLWNREIAAIFFLEPEACTFHLKVNENSMQYWFCLKTNSSGKLVLQWEIAEIFQREMGWWGGSLGESLEGPWLWAPLIWENPWQTGFCLVPQDFIGIWKLNSSHWLLSAVAELCLLLGQELEMRSNCLLCCIPSLLSRISGHFWLSAWDFFPAQTRLTGDGEVCSSPDYMTLLTRRS